MSENLRGREFTRFQAEAFWPHKLEIKIRIRRPSAFQHGHDDRTDQVLIEVVDALARRIAADPDTFIETFEDMAGPKIVN